MAEPSERRIEKTKEAPVTAGRPLGRWPKGTSIGMPPGCRSRFGFARRRLDAMPLGGKTPLAFGLRRGHDLVRRLRVRGQRLDPVLLVVSDCRANVGSGTGHAAVLAELLGAARVRVHRLEGMNESRMREMLRWV